MRFERRNLVVPVAVLGLGFAVFAVRVSQPAELVHGGKTIGQWLTESKIAVGVVRMPGTTLVFPAGMDDEALAGMPSLLATNSGAKIMGGSNGVTSLHFFVFRDGAGLLTADPYAAVQKDAATQALTAMGAEAVPYLREQIERKNPWIEVWYFRVWNKLPVPIRGFLRPPPSAALQRAKAAHALGLLGPQAKGAALELSRLAESDDYPIVRALALEAVERITSK